MTVLQEILEWSHDRPAWQRDALRRLVLNGELSDEDIAALTEICKSEHGLAEQQRADPLSKDHIPVKLAGSDPVSLLSIFHHRGVNALAENQTLSFGPHLTIVYGDNAAGKTGYIRILKSACRARKQEQILGNVISATTPRSPVVSIKYKVGTEAQPREWAGEGDDEYISHVSVFDKQLAKALERKWYFNGAISMPHEMLGFIDAAGNYHRTPFRDAYEYGGVYTFDEVDRSDPVALLAVNPHLANGVATFPDGQIKRHKDCLIVCTANTWGNGANADYCGATKLDAAFLSRFPARLSWNIDKDFEVSITGNEAWAQRVQAARTRAQTAGLKVMIDVRMTLAGAALIASGLSEQEAAEATYLANITPEQRRMIEA